MANKNIAAVIGIGSNHLRLKIGQLTKGNITTLESIVNPLMLGRDTFNTGRISYDKAERCCEIIAGFLNVIKEYGVTHVRVIATSAIREAKNRDYILDQIALKTGLHVDVLDNSEEKFYIYKMMYEKIPKADRESAIMVFSGSGSLGLAVTRDEKIGFVQNIKLGSLRINELFGDVHDYAREFHVLVAEYLESFTKGLSTFLPKTISSFIASGSEMETLSLMCGGQMNATGDYYVVRRSDFNRVFEEIKTLSVDNIRDRYKLQQERAEAILPAMCIIDNLMSFTNARNFISPPIQPVDAVLYEMLKADNFAKITKDFLQSAVYSAKIAARRFNAVSGHVDVLLDFVDKLYERVKKPHGFGARERVLLETATILHAAGECATMVNPALLSYYILREMEIIGLNEREMELVAQIVLHGGTNNATLIAQFSGLLTAPERVLVSKLAALTRLAEALDHSRKQKFTDFDVKLSGDELQVIVTTNENIELEEWVFEQQAAFFQEVYGIRAVIRVRRTI